MSLKTESIRVARSGNTLDGRKIDAAWLEQAAKNYDRERYTAMIWPDHERGYNLGIVDSIEAKKNSESGIDLYAVLVPNGFYQDNIKYGQRLFTSIELMPDFAKTGEWYLSGLAATDNPASLGVQEVKFTQQPIAENCYSVFIEADVEPDLSDMGQWFKKILKKLNTKEGFMENNQSQDTQEFESVGTVQQYASKESVESLTLKLTQLINNTEQHQQTVIELTNQVTALQDKLTNALSEQSATSEFTPINPAFDSSVYA